MKIRKAKATEGDALSALALRSKAVWGYPAAFLEQCVPELTYDAEYLRRHLVFVAERAGLLSGFYTLEHISSARVELGALFVAPEFLRQGTGRALLTHAKSQSRSRGYLKMWIQGDPHAAPFYRSHGARQIGERESGSIPGRMLPLYEIDLTGH